MPLNNWSRGVREAQHHARQQARIEARQNGERSRRSERRAADAAMWSRANEERDAVARRDAFVDANNRQLDRIRAEMREVARQDREARVQRESTANVNSRDRYGEEGFTAEDVRRLQMDERTRRLAQMYGASEHDQAALVLRQADSAEEDAFIKTLPHNDNANYILTWNSGRAAYLQRRIIMELGSYCRHWTVISINAESGLQNVRGVGCERVFIDPLCYQHMPKGLLATVVDYCTTGSEIEGFDEVPISIQPAAVAQEDEVQRLMRSREYYVRVYNGFDSNQSDRDYAVRTIRWIDGQLEELRREDSNRDTRVMMSVDPGRPRTPLEVSRERLALVEHNMQRASSVDEYARYRERAYALRGQIRNLEEAERRSTLDGARTSIDVRGWRDIFGHNGS